ncbi:MAG: hypothetical protein IJO92_05555 [Clostridia bacterium]|nr:hypothetical protein [Clostridia bacterium]
MESTQLFGSGLVGIIIIALVTLFSLWIAGEFHQAATLKGHPQSKYFWICFFCGIVGYLLVIALPDKAQSVHPSSATHPRPNLGEYPTKNQDPQDQ